MAGCNLTNLACDSDFQALRGASRGSCGAGTRGALVESLFSGRRKLVLEPVETVDRGGEIGWSGTW